MNYRHEHEVNHKFQLIVALVFMALALVSMSSCNLSGYLIESNPAPRVYTGVAELTLINETDTPVVFYFYATDSTQFDVIREVGGYYSRHTISNFPCGVYNVTCGTQKIPKLLIDKGTPTLEYTLEGLMR
tara:strand:- start:16501 stop:16890 length:390 start_codon:yes stop_codon:yes gene_type:complete